MKGNSTEYTAGYTLRHKHISLIYTSFMYTTERYRLVVFGKLEAIIADTEQEEEYMARCSSITER